MHAEELRGPRRDRGERRDRDRRRVRGDQRGRFREAVDVANDLELQVQVFRRRFDDEIAGLEIVVDSGTLDAKQCGVLVGRRQFFLLDEAVEARRNSRQPRMTAVPPRRS
jgi:hypothetical protein